MDSFTEDLWAMVLARLPIKISTGFKLVCKQWKSIVESPFFKNLFISAHQNSHSSSWSLMSRICIDLEMVGHYQCDAWGLDRSLGSFIESFLADKQQKHKDQQVSVEAYSDVGLILIHIEPTTYMEKGVIYVANPVTRECVEIFLPIGFETKHCWEWGLVTRTEKGHLLDYKVVFIDKFLQDEKKLSCRIYSSVTGLWSLETFHLPYSSFVISYCRVYSISLNGNLHWVVKSNDHREAVLSMDFYATTSTGGSVPCRVTPFPDLEKTTKFKRDCTPCQGFLHYMNIVDGSKLCLWRLMSEGCWQLMSEISPDFLLSTDGFDYIPLTINPLDARTAYFWSTKRERLVYYNLHNGEFVMKDGSNGEITNAPSLVNNPRANKIYLKSPRDMHCPFERAFLLPFVLPQWLHRIPQNTVHIKQPTTTTRGKETSQFQSERSFSFQEKGNVKAVYKDKPVQSHQQKDIIPSVNRIHGKVVTAIKLSNSFEALDALPE